MVRYSVTVLALALVATLGVHYAANWGRPLGFDWEPVWVVHVDMGPESRTTAGPRLWRVLDEARGFPGVVSAALASPTPYSQSERNRLVEHQGRNLEHRVAAASDDLAGVLGLRLLRGRFFSREDDGAAWQAVVIDETLARVYFGDADPIGPADLRPALPAAAAAPAARPAVPLEGALRDLVDGFEREVIRERLRRHAGHVTNAARSLDLERSHLYKKCRALGLEVRDE